MLTNSNSAAAKATLARQFALLDTNVSLEVPGGHPVSRHKSRHKPK